MEMMEIVLLIAGGIIFILSFFIPDKMDARHSMEKGNSKDVSGKKGDAESVKTLAEGELQGLIGQEMDSVRAHMDDVLQEAVTYAVEKTERSLERLSNEKIMAVSEYSDTVLAEIHKNHEEAMFLYDMLNNKHVNLKNTVSEVNRTVKEAEAAVKSFQTLTPETLVASEERIVNRAAQPAAGTVPERFAQGSSGTGSFGTVGNEINRAGTEKSGIERAGIERAGINRSGMDRAGTEKSGIERLVTGRTEVEGLGTGSFKTKNPGIENPGIERSGAERTGVESLGAERAEIKRAGIGNSGIRNSGIENFGAAKNGTEKSGLERLGASSESAMPGKVSFMQDVDEQGRNNNERILELYQQGRSTVAIAKELGLGVGEVKLVIDLFKNQ